MKLSGSKVPLDLFLQAVMVDKLSWLVWAKTEDARAGKNRPVSVVSLLHGEQESKSKSKYQQFDSGEDFAKRWAELVNN